MRPTAVSCPSSPRATTCVSCRRCWKKCSGKRPERPPVDAVAYTAGPGLIGALLVGAAVGRSLAYAWRVPALGVHHLEAHLLAPLLEPEPPQFPFLALLVSGGHTLLAEVEALGRYRILGQSLDDAAGEAFDKTAKLLGLGLPGGPQLAALAERGRPDVFRFPRPLTDRPGLDFSFSGLKTAVVVAIRDRTLDEQTRADVARAFEDAVVDTLAIKCAARARSHGGRHARRRGWCRRKPAPARAPSARWVQTAGRGSSIRARSSARTMQR